MSSILGFTSFAVVIALGGCTRSPANGTKPGVPATADTAKPSAAPGPAAPAAINAMGLTTKANVLTTPPATGPVAAAMPHSTITPRTIGRVVGDRGLHVPKATAATDK